MKQKRCHSCEKLATVMYRIQISPGKRWVFVCPDCRAQHAKNEFYRYGGTWKGSRH